MDVKWIKLFLSLGASFVLAGLICFFTGLPYVIVLPILIYLNLGLGIAKAFNEEIETWPFVLKLLQMAATVLVVSIMWIAVSNMLDIPPFAAMYLLQSKWGTLPQTPLPDFKPWLALFFNIGLAGIGLLIFNGWTKDGWGKDLVVKFFMGLIAIPVILAIILKLTPLVPATAGKIGGYNSQFDTLFFGIFPSNMTHCWMAFFLSIALLTVISVMRAKGNMVIGTPIAIFVLMVIALCIRASIFGPASASVSVSVSVPVKEEHLGINSGIVFVPADTMTLIGAASDSGYYQIKVEEAPALAEVPPEQRKLPNEPTNCLIGKFGENGSFFKVFPAPDGGNIFATHSAPTDEKLRLSPNVWGKHNHGNLGKVFKISIIVG